MDKIMKELNEGLIMSYDINKCRSYLMKKYPNIKNIRLLKYNPYASPKRYSKYNLDDFVAIDLSSDFSNFMDMRKTCYDFLGWSVSRIDIKAMYKGNTRPYCYHFNDYADCFEEDRTHQDLRSFLSTNPEIRTFSIVIEKKFPREYISDEKTMYFHETRKEALDKILKTGLAPRYDGNFPARLYLGRGLNEIKRMVGEHYEEGVILKVNVDGIRLYQDPKEEAAVFTLENITPSRIEMYDGANEPITTNDDRKD